MLRPLSELRVSVFAGQAGHGGSKDGDKQHCQFDHPMGLLVTEAGAVYVTDFSAHVIRRTTLEDWSLVETVAGNGKRGTSDGLALECSLSQPSGICESDRDGVWIVEEGCSRLRLLEGGFVKTHIGALGSGFDDGPFDIAKLSAPRDVTRSRSGLLFIADNGNNRIRIVDTLKRRVSSIGSGRNSTSDGNFAECSFLYPSSLCCSPDDILFVGELYRVRKIVLDTEVVTTYEGSLETSLTGGMVVSPLFSSRNAHGSENSVIYCDSNGSRIMLLNSDTGAVVPFAGVDRRDRGPDDEAESNVRKTLPLKESIFKSPRGMAFTPQGDLIITDAFSVLRIVREMYPPSYSLNQARMEHFTLENVQRIPITSSHTQSASSSESAPAEPTIAEEEVLGLDVRVATLAYSSILSCNLNEKLEELELPRALQKALEAESTEYPFPLDVRTRIKRLYWAIPATSAVQLIAMLYTIETLQLEKELFDFTIRQLSIALLKRSDISVIIAHLLEIANEEGKLEQVAHLLLETGRKLSVDATTSYDRFTESIEPSHPKFSKFVHGLAHGSIGLPKVWALEAGESGQGQFKTPYLIHRLRALFWSHIGDESLTTTNSGFMEIFTDLKKSSEGQKEDLAISSDLMKPNFYFDLGESSKRIYVHDWVLYSRWPWFAALVDSGLSEIKGGFSSLPPDTLSENTLLALLYYLYTNDSRAIDEKASEELIQNADLFMLAEFGVSPLKAFDYCIALFDHCRSIIVSKLNPSNCVHRLRMSIPIGPQSLTDSIFSYVLDCRTISTLEDEQLDPSIVQEFARLRLEEDSIVKDGFVSPVTLFGDDEEW